MEEIRVIGDKSYKVVSSICTCSCHLFRNQKHIKACCNGGIVERLEEISSSTEELINYTVWLMENGYITTEILSANNIVNRYNDK